MRKKRSDSLFYCLLLVILFVGYYSWVVSLEDRRYDDLDRQEGLFISRNEMVDTTGQVPKNPFVYHATEKELSDYDDYLESHPRKFLWDCSSGVGTSVFHGMPGSALYVVSGDGEHIILK